MRCRDLPNEADYAVVSGGATDKRLHAPLGEYDSRYVTTCKGALNLLIGDLTAKYEALLRGFD